MFKIIAFSFIKSIVPYLCVDGTLRCRGGREQERDSAWEHAAFPASLGASIETLYEVHSFMRVCKVN